MKIYALCAMCLALMAGCTSDEISEEHCNESIENVIMSAEDFRIGNTTTRALISEDYRFVWEANDLIGVYPEKGSPVCFSVKAQDLDVSNNAIFNGADWELKAEMTYSAFYPFDLEQNYNRISASSIPVSFKNQRQLRNATTSHIGAYDYMVAGEEVPVNGSVQFMFKHLCSILHIPMKISNENTFKLFRLSTLNGSNSFITEAVVGTDGTITPVETSNSMQLDLDNIHVSKDEVLNLWMMIAPTNLEGEKLVLTLTDENGVESYSTTDIIASDYKAGYAYNIDDKNAFAPDVIPYITFSADAEQTLRMTSAVEGLEYLVDGQDWEILGTNIVSFGGEFGDLKLRGSNNYGTADYVEVYDSYSLYYGPSTRAPEPPEYTIVYSTIVFGNQDVNVACKGDIRTLSCYDNYLMCDTERHRYSHLFEGCTQLISTPELPSMTLSDYCYSHMFKGCTSLSVAPSLPAKEAYSHCYESMFEDCTSLTEAPDLPATTMYMGSTWFFKWEGYNYSSMFKGCVSLTKAPDILPAMTLNESCYQSMFYGCVNLTRAPELPATNLSSNSSCYSYMFYGCSSLSYIKMLAESFRSSCLTSWTTGVSATGKFVKKSSLTLPEGKDGIPSGWDIETE